MTTSSLSVSPSDPANSSRPPRHDTKVGDGKKASPEGCDFEVDQGVEVVDPKAQTGVFVARSNLSLTTEGDSGNIIPTGTKLKTKDAEYSVVELVGRGGLGDVYKVQGENGFFAVKIINEAGLNSGLTLARFQRELEILEKLKHRNIIPILGQGNFEQRPFFVMPFIEGESLEKLIKRGKLPSSEKANIIVVKIAIEVCDALIYAHEKGIIHRDIKPGNIMISDDNTVYVCDFNIASDRNSTTLNQTGQQIPGTPKYMSPEQAGGKGKDETTSLTDLFSLGVTMYELLTGKVPFDGSSTNVVMARITSRAFEDVAIPPIKINPKVDPELNSIVVGLLQKDPEIGRIDFPNATSPKDRLEELLDELRKREIKQRKTAA